MLSYKEIRSKSINKQKKKYKKSVKKTIKTVTKKNKRKIRSRNKSRIKKGGMEGGQDDIIEIEIRTEEDTKRIRVNPNSKVIESVIGDLGSPHFVNITMGDDEISLERTFNENGIEDGARLNIHKRERFSLEYVLAEIIVLNPDVDEGRLRSKIRFDRINADKPWHIEGDLVWFNLGIRELPESFGDLIVGGNLFLNSNLLTSLPESFGNLTVGGDLYLNDNSLTSLPEIFGNLTVGGDLLLYNNELTSLPNSFGNLKVDGDLLLYNNELTSLPKSFGNLTVGGDLSLRRNLLTSLPKSFVYLRVGGEFFHDFPPLS